MGKIGIKIFFAVFFGYLSINNLTLLSRDTLPSSYYEKEKEIWNLFMQGLYSLERGDYEEALSNFQKILIYEPENQSAKTYIEEVKKRMRLRIFYKGKRLPTKVFPPPVKGAYEEVLEEAKNKYLRESYKKAVSLYSRGDFKNSLKIFKEIAEVELQYKDTLIYLARLRLKEAEGFREKKLEEMKFKYTLGPQDVISINVLNHPELSGTVTIEADGEIILPLVKEVVNVRGLTKEELAKKLEKILAKYVKTPQVSVVILGYNSKKWYILGEVARPGEYPMGKRKLTLMEALYTAGLIKENRAAVGRVVVIKPRKHRPQYKVINVANILYKGLMKDNIYLEPNTIIYVPKTVVAKISDTLGILSGAMTHSRSLLEDLISTSNAARMATPLKEILGPTRKDQKKYP